MHQNVLYLFKQLTTIQSIHHLFKTIRHGQDAHSNDGVGQRDDGFHRHGGDFGKIDGFEPPEHEKEPASQNHQQWMAQNP